MLQAVLHGKAGRIEHEGEESVSWRQLFQTREDLMTAAVFSRFTYLSSTTQNSLLQAWLHSNADFSQFESIEYWPRYGYIDDAAGLRDVEPDIVLRFNNFNILIEIKPPTGGDQYYQQWQREIAAFIHSDTQKNLPIYFLAIGRIEHKDAQLWGALLLNQHPDRLKSVHAIKWQPVVDSIRNLLTLEMYSKQDSRILIDILDAMQLYGLKTQTFKWDGLNRSPLAHSIMPLPSTLSAAEFSYKSKVRMTMLSQIIKQLPEIEMETISQWNR